MLANGILIASFVFNSKICNAEELIARSLIVKWSPLTRLGAAFAHAIGRCCSMRHGRDRSGHANAEEPATRSLLQNDHRSRQARSAANMGLRKGRLPRRWAQRRGERIKVAELR